jgi:hypothetical protein
MLRHLNLAKIQSLMVCGVSVMDGAKDIFMDVEWSFTSVPYNGCQIKSISMAQARHEDSCRLMLEGRLNVVKMESISGICGGGTKTAMLIGSNDQL